MKQTEPKKSAGLLSLKKIFQHPDFVFWSSVALWIILVLMLVIFLGVMFSEYISRIVTCWLGTKETEVGTSKYETLKFIGLGMSGILVAIGAIAINRRADAQVKNVIAQVENNQLIEKGHTNERFKSAIESLGHNDASVRIASFYQFYHLAKEGKDDFRHNIFEILCSRLRSMPQDISHLTEEDEQKRPRAECQTLLDILFQSEGERIFGKFHANLRKAFLAYASLTDVNLVDANFSGANLMAAFLQNTDASNAFFSSANLEKANFEGANLMRAGFLNANLVEANLSSANFTNANFMGADLTDARIEDADFTNAIFVGTHLTNTNLPFVRSLERANFLWAKIGDRDISPEDLPTNKGQYIAPWATPEFWTEVEKNEKS